MKFLKDGNVQGSSPKGPRVCVCVWHAKLGKKQRALILFGFTIQETCRHLADSKQVAFVSLCMSLSPFPLSS